MRPQLSHGSPQPDICARLFISDEVFRAFALLRFVLLGTGASSGLRFSGCHVRPGLASTNVLFRAYYLTSGHDNHRFDVPLNRGAGTSIFRAAVASFGGERRILNGQGQEQFPISKTKSVI